MENKDENKPIEEVQGDETEQEEVVEVELTNEERLEQELEEVKNDYLRSRADFENFRKRSQEELLKAKEKAVAGFVEDLLPNIDNFEASLKMTQNMDEKNSEMFVKGVEMIHQNLLNVLSNHSISMYEPQVGDQFDAKLHDPVLVDHKEHTPGTIVGIMSKGYQIKDSILRPARVQVVKEKESSSEE